MIDGPTLSIIRSWIGEGETDEELTASYELLGSYDAMIRFYIRKRIITLAAQPTSFSVPGLSISNGQNITTWQAVLKLFNTEGGSGLDGDPNVPDPGGMKVGRLVRPDLR